MTRYRTATTRLNGSERSSVRPEACLAIVLLGLDFSAQQTYKLSVLERFVSGDLGAYWDGEINWKVDEQTLVVGPVPETAPGLPVALWLRFDGATLASVEAAMASGTRYRFHATASQP